MTDLNDTIGTGIGLGVGLAVTGSVLNQFDRFGRRVRKNVRRKKKKR